MTDERHGQRSTDEGDCSSSARVRSVALLASGRTGGRRRRCRSIHPLDRSPSTTESEPWVSFQVAREYTYDPGEDGVRFVGTRFSTSPTGVRATDGTWSQVQGETGRPDSSY